MITDQNVPEWGKEIIKGFADLTKLVIFAVFSKKYGIKSRVEAKRDEICNDRK